MFMNFHEEFLHSKFSRCQLILEILETFEIGGLTHVLIILILFGAICSMYRSTTICLLFIL